LNRQASPCVGAHWANSPRRHRLPLPARTGQAYRGDLFVGSANVRGANIFRLPIHDNRRDVDADDRRLRDGVADNIRKYDMTESESLLFGTGFGVTPDIRESPAGTLYAVSSSTGTIYEIRRR